MSDTTMVNVVRQLDLPPDRRVRQAMLQEIVNKLDLEDRIALTGMISRKNDLFSTLPADLLLSILDFLPIFEAWRLQLVCRSWRAIFSNEVILRAVLAARWETHDSSDQAGDRTLEPVSAKIRRVQIRRRGQPFTRAGFDRGYTEEDKYPNVKQQSRQTMALKGRHLACVDFNEVNGDTVVLKDLMDQGLGDIITRPRDRARIRCIALSSTLLACVTHSGRLIVRSVVSTDKDEAWLRLPSDSVNAIHADCSIVAIVLTASLIVYDYDSGKLVQHHLDQPRRKHKRKLIDFRPTSTLVNAQAGTVDIFYQDPRPHSHTSDIQDYVEHRRFSLQGVWMSSSCWPSAGEKGLAYPLYPCRFKFTSLYPTGVRDRYVFPGACLLDFDYKGHFGLLTFNAKKAHLEVQYVEASGGEIGGPFALWKNILFLIPVGDQGEYAFDPFMTEDSRPVEGEEVLRYHKTKFGHHIRHHSPLFSVLVNDSFVVYSTTGYRMRSDQRSPVNTIHVHCYEEGATDHEPEGNLWPRHFIDEDRRGAHVARERAIQMARITTR